jgi:hypothetical protein
LLLPGTTEEGAQMVVLIALFFGIFVAVEYGAVYPALIEFRDAPPFNRLRVLSLLAMLFCLSLVAGGAGPDSSLRLVLNALGFLVGTALDFPWSPLGMVIGYLPSEAPFVSPLQVKVMAGLALLIALIALAVFVLFLRRQNWPHRDQAFNVWVNLPTFDPTTGGDIVARLIRDGRINALLGIFMAFAFPVVGLIGTGNVGASILSSPHAMVWGIALWMFLPLSMFMRALAMMRIADMIRERRAWLVASIASDAPRTA